MCGAMAFSSALLLFVVTCMRDEEQFKMRLIKKKEVAEEKKKKAEQKKLGVFSISVKSYDNFLLIKALFTLVTQGCIALI